MASESKSSLWGTVGWWMLLGMGIAFIPYAFVFVKGDFEQYKYITTTWAQGKYDIAGLNILHHLRAWQIHSAAAIVFICMGPFQFSPSFRAKFRTTHRIFGYAFVISGLVLSFSALTVLIPNTDFGPIAQKIFVFQAPLLLFFLFVAVKSARAKKFKVHQQYMIRAAATGYAVIPIRPFIFIQAAIGMPIPMAMEISAVIAPILCLGLGELYIRRVLLKPKQAGQEIGESGGLVGPGGDIVQQAGESGSTSDSVNGHRPSGNNRERSPPSASATWQGRPYYYRSAGAAVLVSFPLQRTNRLAARYDRAPSLHAPMEGKVLQRRPRFSNRTFRVSQPSSRSFSKPDLVSDPMQNVYFKRPVLLAF